MLKIGALVLLVLGVVAGAAGGVGLYLKPDANVTIEAPLGEQVLVVPPEVVALAGEHALTVAGDGFVEVRTARPVDAAAWLEFADAQVLEGISTWSELAVRDQPAAASVAAGEATPSDDIWRTTFTTAGKAELVGEDIESGVTVIVEATSGESLSRVALDWDREVGFGWVTPALSGGALLAAVGLVMLVVRFLDMRPAGARVEAAAAKMRKRGSDKGPGIRRARREAAEREAREGGAGASTDYYEPAETEEAT